MKRLILDIETVPNVGLFWKSGWKITISPDNIVQEKQIACICWKWEGHRRVFSAVNHTLDAAGEKAMLEAFMEVAETADELVAHNGDKFDLKWVSTQLLIHGLPPFPEPKSVDTLVIARRRFYLNSNRLDYVAHLLLGEGKTDIPYQVWKDIVLNIDRAANMALMVDYCKKDVRLLERVFVKLSPFHAPKTHIGVLNGNPRWSCARCGSMDVRRKKQRVTQKGIRQHSMVCKSCGGYYTIANLIYENFKEATR